MKAFVVVFALISVDILTGLSYALFTKTFKSSIMREGAMHKFGELVAMAMMYLLEATLPELGITHDVPLVNFAAVYLSLMEVGSVFENVGKLNPEIDGMLNAVMDKIRGDKHE